MNILNKLTFGMSLNISILILILFSPLCASSEQKELLIGLIPEENIFKQMDRYKPLASYLSEKLGIKVRLTILSKYGDVIDKFISRKMDGAFFEAFTANLAMEKLNVEPLARPVNPDGTSTVQSYVFVRKEGDIKSVKDMRGKRVAFVDKASATGYLFAIAFFRENGVKDIGSYFSEYYFTGSQDSVVYAVLDNRADIGSAGSRIYKRIIDKDPGIKDELRIMAISREIPDITLCMRRDLAPEVKLRIKEVLLNMDKNPAGKEILKKFKASGFIGADKDNFKPVSDLAKKAGIDIKRYQ